MKGFSYRLWSICALAANFFYALHLAGCYLLLSAKRACGLPPTFKHPVRTKLRYKNHTFEFFIDQQLDFDVLRDTFSLEEYKIKNPGDVRTIFDIGSNIGATVAYFAIEYPDAHIYAFEADPVTAKKFVRNSAQFGSRVTFFPKAVWSADNDTVTFYSLDIHWASSLIERPGSHGVVVPTITLDHVIEEDGIETVDLVKFDIEGGEYEAFKNCTSLHRMRTLIGEIHPDVLSVSVEEFLALFPGFTLIDRVEHGNINVILERT